MKKKNIHFVKVRVTSVTKRIKLAIGVLMLANVACSDSHDQQEANSNQTITQTELLNYSATQAVELLKSGEVSVQTVTQALLNQATKHGQDLNAFITLDHQHAIDAAKKADAKRGEGKELGALFGVSISLKDLIVTKDMTTTFGTDKFKDFVPERNAPLVDKLLAADAIIIGKNNNQEWAFGSNGYNSHYGQQLNPYDQTRIAGGSTGGGAAAVSARIVPIAIGSDTAASIRVPAAYTGLFGLRPTTGRYDNSGVAPIAPTLDTVGPLTRSVDDLALIDSVLSDDTTGLAKIDLTTLRLGVPKAFFHDGISTEMQLHFTALLARLKGAGVTLVEIDLANTKELVDNGLYPILFYETYPAVTQFLQQWGDGTTINQLHQALGSDIKAMWDQLVMPNAPEAIAESVYLAAINEVRPKMQSTYTAYFSDNDVSAIIFPATASEAPLAKPDNPQTTVIDGKEVSIFINDNNSSPGALAGQPGVVMPMAMTANGLPLAVSLDGKRNQDRELLAIAKQLSLLIPKLPTPTITKK